MRTLVTLAAPLVAANLSRTVMSLVDALMVARLGSDALAAVGAAGLVLWTMAGFGYGVMTLISTCVSQSLGAGRPEKCARYAWQGMYLSLLYGAAVLPLLGGVEWMFRVADHGPSVMEMEVAYTRIGLFSVGPTTACVALVGFFAGVHRSGVGFVATLVANVFNVAANYVLIFGHFGCPALGVAGAAWATLAASVLQMGILLGWFLRRRYREAYATHRSLAPQRPLIRDILARGVPSGTQFSTDIGAWTVFAVYFVGQFGAASLAANAICFKFLEVSFMPASGLGQALTASFGKAFGQGDMATARRTTCWSLLLVVSYMVGVGLLMALFRVELPSIFTDDEEVIQIAATLMILCAIFQAFDALQITFYGALRGAGDTLWPAVVVVTLLLVVLVGGGWGMARWRPEWGAAGVWMAATAYLAVVGCVLGVRYHFGPWERMKIVGG